MSTGIRELFGSVWEKHLGVCKEEHSGFREESRLDAGQASEAAVAVQV